MWNSGDCRGLCSYAFPEHPIRLDGQCSEFIRVSEAKRAAFTSQKARSPIGLREGASEMTHFWSIVLLAGYSSVAHCQRTEAERKALETIATFGGQVERSQIKPGAPVIRVDLSQTEVTDIA